MGRLLFINRSHFVTPDKKILMLPVVSQAIRKVLSVGNAYSPKRFISTSINLYKKPNVSNHKGATLVSKITGREEDLWQLYNEVIYPPVPKVSNSVLWDNNLRPGEVTHRREDILYSHKKLWMLAHLIRGRSVDDAFSQLGFRTEKGARILEELTSNSSHIIKLCNEESVHISRGRMVPRLYKGLRSVPHKINYHYTDLYIRLREGDPPKIYHPCQIKGVWTPAPTCPPEGRSWGSTREMVRRELERLRGRRLKGEL
ncbi:39S ribosomal protein L22, mitochondrial [Schistosoma japonicum]|nr:39S ribosomal protein L22, mitochondrial [Schistosoma japonicum]